MMPLFYKSRLDYEFGVIDKRFHLNCKSESWLPLYTTPTSIHKVICNANTILHGKGLNQLVSTCQRAYCRDDKFSNVPFMLTDLPEIGYLNTTPRTFYRGLLDPKWGQSLTNGSLPLISDGAGAG